MRVPCLALALHFGRQLGAGMALFGLTSAGSTMALAGQESVPVAASVKLETVKSLTRLTFSTSTAVAATAWLLANPDRVIVDLPEMEFRIDPAPVTTKVQKRPGAVSAKSESAAITRSGVVAGYRFGLFSPGKSRIVIDLSSPARLVRATSETAANGATQFVIELAAADRAAFLVEARRRAPDELTSAILPPPSADTKGLPGKGLPVVVIDAGHGGLDPGAQASNGALEKDVVFDFSRVLVAILEARGRYRVVMTRSSDVFVPLDERVKIARDAGASLFVSIHADILADEPGVSGATVYTVSEKASDRQAARVAEKENQADSIAGVEASDDNPDVSDILFDLARRETRAFSHVFARTLVGYIRQVSPLNKNPHRSAGFRVLKAPDVPSVLLELGYFSSTRDVANLTAPEWRQKAADSVARSIDEFFRAQTGEAARTAEFPLDLKRGLASEEAGHVVGGKH